MKPPGKLDGVDRRILNALQEDAQLTHAALGKKVGASTTSVWRRIKLLEAFGVLGPMVRVVRPTAVGLTGTVLCLVRLKSHLREHAEAFETFVVERGEVLQCDVVTGSWDYLVRVAVKDVADYDRFLTTVLLSHPSVATATSHFALRQIKTRAPLPV